MIYLLSIFLGVFMVLKGFQIKYHPEKARVKKAFRRVGIGKNRENQIDFVNQPELQTPYFLNFLITGVLFIVSGVLGYAYGINLTYLMLYSAFIAAVVFMITVQATTGQFNIKSVVAVLALLGLIIATVMANKNSKVEVLPEMLSIEGDYGTTLYYQSIDSVLVINELPKTKSCQSGYSSGKTKKGSFCLKDGTDVKFYVLGNEAPYLEMYTNFGRMYVNRKTSTETEQLIEELRDKIGDKIVN